MAELLLPSDCNNCGACCHDNQIELNPNEADQLVAAGTKLTPVWKMLGLQSPDILRNETPLKSNSLQDLDHILRIGDYRKEYQTILEGNDLYSMDGPCGNLRDGQCADYANRPAICSSFPVSSIACLVFRDRDDLNVFASDIPIAITTR